MQNSYPVSALLYGLEDELASELMGTLMSCCKQVQRLAQPASLKKEVHSADVIFCPADVEQVKELRSLSPDSPLIVASRIPEVNDWLDALEAGATDYCAAPFERSQIQWMLNSHVRPAA